MEVLIHAKDPLQRLTDIELQTSDKELVDFCELLRHFIAQRLPEGKAVGDKRRAIQNKKRVDGTPRKTSKEKQ
jgi:hypothetical protein